MKVLTLAFLFQFVLSCWPKVDIMVFEQIEENLPSAGIKLRLSGGDNCAANMRARKTIIEFQA